MKLTDVHDGMKVRITAGAPEHPLNGRIAEVVLVTAPLPPAPPSRREDVNPALQRLIGSNEDAEEARLARAYRVKYLETPFAWPEGQVTLYLLQREEMRCWAHPYVMVGPDDIEPA